MATGMKYVMYDRNGIDTPILFPPMIKHDNLAMMVVPSGKLISAGFVMQVDEGRIEAYGESKSLGLKSRGREDSKIIEDWLTFSL